ncbi:MAG: cupin domain-containing protein [Alphaproteobacteria bacterium]
MSDKIKQISKNENYNAISIGPLNELENKTQRIGAHEMKGKIFVKDLLGLTGTEISFSTQAPKSEIPFFHTHKENEEVYIILSGEGKFQVDDDCFDIREGSIIKVSPKGKRCLYNSSNETMIYLVIQAKENSLSQYTFTDGEFVKHIAKWKE